MTKKTYANIYLDQNTGKHYIEQDLDFTLEDAIEDVRCKESINSLYKKTLEIDLDDDLKAEIIDLSDVYHEYKLDQLSDSYSNY